jgi:hypothetical protein
MGKPSRAQKLSANCQLRANATAVVKLHDVFKESKVLKVKCCPGKQNAELHLHSGFNIQREYT